MAEKVGHTAIAVLQGRKAFKKGGGIFDIDVNDPGAGPKGETFLTGVNRLITENEGNPLTMTSYREALAADAAAPDNPALARLVAQRTGLPVKRTAALISRMRSDTTIAKGLLSRTTSEPKPSPFDSASPEQTYGTFAAQLRIKLRQQAKKATDIESEQV
tara:strand:- start:9 stop:488 length:480 start_codon:yes stop_codon:yes gene_type:complete